MKTATFVKNLTAYNYKGDARLYRVDPPAQFDGEETEETTEFVVVSATHVVYSGPETYIFPADSSGEIIDWGELEGSFRGGLDHACALENAGYEVLP